MIEGSWSVPRTNVSGSGRSKNIRIRSTVVNCICRLFSLPSILVKTFPTRRLAISACWSNFLLPESCHLSCLLSKLLFHFPNRCPAFLLAVHIVSRGRIQRKTWRMGPYAGVDYNIVLCPLQSRLLHIYHGQPYASVDLNPMRLYPPVRDLAIGISILAHKIIALSTFFKITNNRLTDQLP